MPNNNETDWKFDEIIDIEISEQFSKPFRRFFEGYLAQKYRILLYLVDL